MLAQETARVDWDVWFAVRVICVFCVQAVCVFVDGWLDGNPIQTDRTQSGFPGRVDEGWQESRMRRNTNPIQPGRAELRLHRTGGWLDERIDRAPSPNSYNRSV